MVLTSFIGPCHSHASALIMPLSIGKTVYLDIRILANPGGWTASTWPRRILPRMHPNRRAWPTIKPTLQDLSAFFGDPHGAFLISRPKAAFGIRGPKSVQPGPGARSTVLAMPWQPNFVTYLLTQSCPLGWPQGLHFWLLGYCVPVKMSPIYPTLSFP